MPDQQTQNSSPEEIENFISRWQSSGAAERSNYALFLSELCDLLDVERPDPSTEDNEQNDYVIDRALTRNDRDAKSSTVYSDLYKRGHFVLETKQGSIGTTPGGKVGHGKRGTLGWDKALEKAYNQAFEYIRDIPADHRQAQVAKIPTRASSHPTATAHHARQQPRNPLHSLRQPRQKTPNRNPTNHPNPRTPRASVNLQGTRNDLYSINYGR